MSTRDPKSDVLQLNLSRFHSLDIVRLPKSRKYRVVFAERFGVQRRAFVEISFEEAHKLALFLVNVEDKMVPHDPYDPPTNPSRPTKMPPPEIERMALDEMEREAVPEGAPLPPIPDIPRARRPSTGDAVPRETENFDDPRTGVIPLEYQDTELKKDD